MKTSEEIWAALEAPFPFSEIEVKVQALTKNMDKGLAICYLDARSVRRRLNSILGRDNWSAEYRPDSKGVVCRLTLKVGESTRVMEEGADYTDIASYKGGISDAFKRCFAAMCNDSLYETDLGWQPCETYEGGDGKKRFKGWTSDALRNMEGIYNRQVGLTGAAKAPTGPEKKEPQKPDPFKTAAGKFIKDIGLNTESFNQFKSACLLGELDWVKVALAAKEEGIKTLDGLIKKTESQMPVDGQKLADKVREIFNGK